jgi:hypothetical protein
MIVRTDIDDYITDYPLADVQAAPKGRNMSARAEGPGYETNHPVQAPTGRDKLCRNH